MCVNKYDTLKKDIEKLFFLVYIGPWVKREEDNHQYNLSKFHLVEDNMSIQVGISGLYMISVQVQTHPLNYNNTERILVIYAPFIKVYTKRESNVFLFILFYSLRMNNRCFIHFSSKFRYL